MKFRFLFTIIFLCFCETPGVSCNVTLSCYDCEETFEERWDPYTDCQIYPMSTPIKPCLDHEVYCLVQRITVKGMTISIKRKCTSECYYGCRAHNFGLTTMTCTSCCQKPGCNIDNAAIEQQYKFWTYFFMMVTCYQLTS